MTSAPNALYVLVHHERHELASDASDRRMLPVELPPSGGRRITLGAIGIIALVALIVWLFGL